MLDWPQDLVSPHVLLLLPMLLQLSCAEDRIWHKLSRGRREEEYSYCSIFEKGQASYNVMFMVSFRATFSRRGGLAL